MKGSLTSSVTFDVARCIRLISQWLGCSVGPGIRRGVDCSSSHEQCGSRFKMGFENVESNKIL